MTIALWIMIIIVGVGQVALAHALNIRIKALEEVHYLLEQHTRANSTVVDLLGQIKKQSWQKVADLEAETRRVQDLTLHQINTLQTAVKELGCHNLNMEIES